MTAQVSPPAPRPVAPGTPVYLINLDRRPDRLADMQQRLKGVAYTRFSAVDGLALSQEEIRAAQTLGRRPLTAGEVACARSHQTVWRSMIDSGQEWACVLEDDVYLSPDLPGFLADPDWRRLRLDLIKLETMRKPVRLSWTAPAICSRRIHVLRSAHLGTAGYLVRARAARALLRLSDALDRPLDALMWDVKVVEGQDLRAGQVVPALCVQDFVIGHAVSESDISVGREALEVSRRVSGCAKVWREISRPIAQLAGVGGLLTGRLTRVAFR